MQEHVWQRQSTLTEPALCMGRGRPWQLVEASTRAPLAYPPLLACGMCTPIFTAVPLLPAADHALLELWSLDIEDKEFGTYSRPYTAPSALRGTNRWVRLQQKKGQAPARAHTPRPLPCAAQTGGCACSRRGVGHLFTPMRCALCPARQTGVPAAGRGCLASSQCSQAGLSCTRAVGTRAVGT